MSARVARVCAEFSGAIAGWSRRSRSSASGERSEAATMPMPCAILSLSDVGWQLYAMSRGGATRVLIPGWLSRYDGPILARQLTQERSDDRRGTHIYDAAGQGGGMGRLLRRARLADPAASARQADRLLHQR